MGGRWRQLAEVIGPLARLTSVGNSFSIDMSRPALAVSSY
jgi:hypothetical protein